MYLYDGSKYGMELLDIELAIVNASIPTDEYFEGGNGEGLFGLMERLANDVAFIIDKMMEYGKKLSVDFAIMISKPVMKHKLSKIRKNLDSSMKVQIPDFEAVNRIYRSSSQTFVSELKKLLKCAKKINSPQDLEFFLKKQKEFETKLTKFESDIDDVIKHPKKYPVELAYNDLERLLSKNNPYINYYYRVIHELEYFKAEYTSMVKKTLRETKKYAYTTRAMKVQKGIIARAASTFMKTLKKIIFTLAGFVIV